MREANYDELVRYLLMARNSTNDQQVGTELVSAYAKADRLGGVEEFVSGTNTANVQTVGERLYAEQAYEAAKSSISQFPSAQSWPSTMCSWASTPRPSRLHANPTTRSAGRRST